MKNIRFHCFNWLVRWADARSTRMLKMGGDSPAFRAAVKLEFRLVRLRGRYHGPMVDFLRVSRASRSSGDV